MELTTNQILLCTTVAGIGTVTWLLRRAFPVSLRSSFWLVRFMFNTITHGGNKKLGPVDESSISK